jgi:hypothetical protein
MHNFLVYLNGSIIMHTVCNVRSSLTLSLSNPTIEYKFTCYKWQGCSNVNAIAWKKTNNTSLNDLQTATGIDLTEAFSCFYFFF